VSLQLEEGREDAELSVIVRCSGLSGFPRPIRFPKPTALPSTASCVVLKLFDIGDVGLGRVSDQIRRITERIMPRIAPVAESDADDQVLKTYGRLKELFGGDTLPQMILQMGRVEPFLRDFYMNFKKFVWSGGQIDETTKAAVALAVAAHAKSDAWLDFYIERVKSLGGDDQRVADIVAVASTNYMYNTFYKFRDLAGSSLFEGMGVGLRAHTFANTSLDEKTVELINIAISDINACRPCTSGHVSAAGDLGLSHEALLEAIQCAATVYAGCQFTNAAGSS
jgi:lipoyl-dependent peroxiredoxin subunit D